MSSLTREIRRGTQASMGRGYKTKGERKRAGAVRHQTAKDEMFAGAQMPDEEDIRRVERRKAARRRGSRAETILTDQLGG